MSALSKYKAYPEYKDSGVEWLGEIPIHWDVFLFKRVISSIKDGTHGTHARVDDGEIFLSAKNVFNNGVKIGLTESRISNKDYEEIISNGFPVKGDILITSVGTIGRSCVYDFDKPIAFQRSVCFLRLNSKGFAQFYKYFIESKFYQSQLVATIKSSAQGGVYMGDLINTVVINNSHEEQAQIANFLDHETAKIDSLIAKQEKLIELLKEKRQAVISHAVTKGLNPNVPMKDSGVEWLGEVPKHWGMARLRRYLLDHRQGYYTTESYVDEGLKLLRITDLGDLGGINISNCPMVNKSDTTELFKLNKGDVVFARTGGAGAFGVIAENHADLIFASYLIRFRLKDNFFEANYLKYLFQADSFQLSVKQNIHGGVNQNIHAEDIKNTIVCAPTLLEQQEILGYLDQQCLIFHGLIQKAIYSVDLMQERRTTLISAAVTGKIDVRDWICPDEAHAEKVAGEA